MLSRKLKKQNLKLCFSFNQASLLDPKNKEILQLKKQLNEKIQQHDHATAKAMGKMFQK
jgi:hypothetical protein